MSGQRSAVSGQPVGKGSTPSGCPLTADRCRLFLYEHITATCPPDHPLYPQGRAMQDALRADLAAVPDVTLLPTEAEFDQAVRAADGCLLIAPETGGTLEALARRVLALGGRLLGCTPDAIRLAGDKLALAEAWRRAGVPTPTTELATPSFDRFPAVVKPRDGAGSEATTLVRDASEYERARKNAPGEMIVQPFALGLPASVAFMVGPSRIVALCPARQRLSNDGRFRYLGGELPLSPDLAARALALGRAALAAAPGGLLGYVGVDLVLGETDYAIEINPRLTSSYIGLRAATATNLAGAMLKACRGKAIDPVEWRSKSTTWTTE